MLYPQRHLPSKLPSKPSPECPNSVWNLVRFSRHRSHVVQLLIDSHTGLDFERASYEPLLHTKDRLEALQAFKEKRAPVFKGE